MSSIQLHSITNNLAVNISYILKVFELISLYDKPRNGIFKSQGICATNQSGSCHKFYEVEYQFSTLLSRLLAVPILKNTW